MRNRVATSMTVSTEKAGVVVGVEVSIRGGLSFYRITSTGILLRRTRSLP